MPNASFVLLALVNAVTNRCSACLGFIAPVSLESFQMPFERMDSRDRAGKTTPLIRCPSWGLMHFSQRLSVWLTHRSDLPTQRPLKSGLCRSTRQSGSGSVASSFMQLKPRSEPLGQAREEQNPIMRKASCMSRLSCPRSQHDNLVPSLRRYVLRF